MSITEMNNVSMLLLLLLLVAVDLSYGQTPCTSELNNTVQLNNQGVFMSSPEAGRVEICVCSTSSNSSCFWQTVSTGSPSQPLSWKNCIVVCRELGYLDVQSPIIPNTVASTNHAPSSVSIFPSLFNCEGTESALSECATLGNSFTSHTSDAYVTCQTGFVTNKLRLTGSTAVDEGIVEYNSITGWTTICPDSWTDNEANVTCVSLGYQSGTKRIYVVRTFRGGNINTAPSISSVSCSGTESTFTSCTITQSTTCALSTLLAGVVCVSDSTSTEGSVRVYDTGSISGYSRVEVLYNGRWGTVCDASWDISDGQVVCRELGGNVDQTQVPASSVSFSSTSSRPIWIFGYTCDGSEPNLRSCTRPAFPVGFVSDTCNHMNDAGVICVQPSTSSQGGLSGGAIAGIVVGCVVFSGLVLWGIGAMDKKKKADLAQQHQRERQAREQQERQAREQRERQQREEREREERLRQEREAAAVSGSGTEIEMTRQGIDSAANNPNSELTNQVAPPSYNEALHHLEVKSPPEYPDEEKKLPYPQETSFNPAYPSAPSVPAGPDYQGYPPPTQPYPPGFIPEISVQDPSAPPYLPPPAGPGIPGNTAPYPPPPAGPGIPSNTTPYPPF